MIDWRSALFVPADATERVGKAATRGADAVILDLEDGVAPAAKACARAAIGDHVRTIRGGGVPVAVRINAGWIDALADLTVAVAAGAAAVVVPKCEDAAPLRVIAAMLDELEAAHDCSLGTTAVVALVESPAGLAHAASLAAEPRVGALALGSEDFSLALGIDPTPAGLAWPVRQLALAAAVQGIGALAVPLSIANYQDEEGLRTAAAEARAVGATGALCIHPAQVAIANATFGTTETEITSALAVVKAWSDGDGEERGVVTFDGRMIDRPVVERAYRILRRPECGTITGVSLGHQTSRPRTAGENPKDGNG